MCHKTASQEKPGIPSSSWSSCCWKPPVREGSPACHSSQHGEGQVLDRGWRSIGDEGWVEEVAERRSCCAGRASQLRCNFCHYNGIFSASKKSKNSRKPKLSFLGRYIWGGMRPLGTPLTSHSNTSLITFAFLSWQIYVLSFMTNAKYICYGEINLLGPHTQMSQMCLLYLCIE